MIKQFPTLSDYVKDFHPENIKSENFDKITENLYLGNIEGAAEFNLLKKEGITHVLSMIGEFNPSYTPEQKLIRKIVPIGDFPTANIIQYFKECIDFIESGKKTYVHCMMGVSRSATIVIAYLMWKTHSDFNNTMIYVKSRRRFISPNEGFEQQLKIFDDLLKKNNYDLTKINLKEIKWEYKFGGLW